MKNPQRIIAIVICLVLAIAVLGSIISATIHRRTDNADPSAPATSTKLSAVTLYEQAADIVSAAQDLTLSIAESITTTTENGVFSERSERSVQYTGLGTESMSALMEETLSIGNYNVSYSEFYHDSIMYLTLGGSHFSVSISDEEFCKRNIPATLFDTSLYSNIDASQMGSSTIIKFDAPTAAEIWALPEGAVFHGANGLATLNETLHLTMSTYDISYSIGSTQFTKHIQISLKTDPVYLFLPNTESFIHIQHPDAPIILEKACGYLMQAQSVTANIQDTIICDAFGDDREQTISIDMYGEESKFMARLDLTVLLVNSSRGGEELRRHEKILLRDGKYSVTIDGVPSPTNAEIAARDMRINCQDLLLSTILLPEYIAGISFTDLGDSYRFDFSATSSLAKTMCRSACDILYKDSELLINLSSDSSTENLGAYLQIQKDTGLPTASGIFYTGNYTIDGHSYMLKYQTDQTYSAASNTAYSTITG